LADDFNRSIRIVLPLLVSPFQGFFQRADALGGLRGVEDQPAQRQQFCLHRFWIGAENRIDRGI
jgi:hypothetical protein